MRGGEQPGEERCERCTRSLRGVRLPMTNTNGDVVAWCEWWQVVATRLFKVGGTGWGCDGIRVLPEICRILGLGPPFGCDGDGRGVLTEGRAQDAPLLGNM